MRGLNLYSFYAILIPGVAVVLGLVPLLPAGLEVNILTAVVPVAAAGFITGQAIHTLAVLLQSVTAVDELSTSHRELFIALLRDQKLLFDPNISEDLIGAFTNRVNSSMSGGLETKVIHEADITNASLDPDLQEAPVVPWVVDSFQPIPAKPTDRKPDRMAAIYALVRGRIHIDGRGRSRVFQSTYAFCRSIFVALPVIWGVYVAYAISTTIGLQSIIGRVAGLDQASSLFYTPIVANKISEPSGVVLLTTVTVLPLLLLFYRATKQYKRYYVEYTMVDYVTITAEGD
ncbi:hypothetical protein [Halosegnis marinus]|uniref:Uncharacterized protein n=1 Tax=Halosegnis marinus TaxID=3034023 RepID=A0ABD5ZTU9_9EURY|nr:hypothetical protein [Halosegnis sp. DT85]